MDESECDATLLQEPFLKGFEVVLFLDGGVGDVAKAATLYSNEVSKEIRKFPKDAAIGFVDAD